MTLSTDNDQGEAAASNVAAPALSPAAIANGSAQPSVSSEPLVRVHV